MTVNLTQKTKSGAWPVAAPGSVGEPTDPDMTVPESKRFCESCREPVGRGRHGSPGRPKGFCQECGAPFDFNRSRVGETVANRYVIQGKVGRGGHGTALLAHDLNLNTDVVLKYFTTLEAQETAELERDTLTGLRHDNIVRIYGYEPQEPALVLEYVRGAPLSREPTDQLEDTLAHGLQILQALDYLHAKGLLHMDVKPANVIRFSDQGTDGPRDRVRLIDFGAVRKLGTPEPVRVCTEGFAPKEGDQERRRPTRGFDLYCLGVTLRALCDYDLNGPVTPAVEALELSLNRATHKVPERRFVSARQFAEQLSGVIQQAVATHRDRRVIRSSAIFGSMSEPLHGGLGAPRPMGHWVKAKVTGQRLTMAPPFGVPEPQQVAASLPAPLADPGDPGLTRSCNDNLLACLTALRNGEPGAADSALRGAPGLPAWAWIGDWYRGLIALARKDMASARDHFGQVRASLPGDLIPLLALGLCAEITGDWKPAAQHYTVVADAAPSLSAAGFGLARAHLVAGDRGAAVDAAKRLAADLQSQAHRAAREAQIAVVRLLAAVTESSNPTEDELAEATELVGEIRPTEREETMLAAEIQYGRSCATDDWAPLTDEIRKVARMTRAKEEVFPMIDLANQLRPPIEWRWQRKFQAIWPYKRG